MRLSIKSRSASSALIILTVIIVIVLSALQYRLSDQISESTGSRLADSLLMSMINWHSNLLRDFSEICFVMDGGRQGWAGGNLSRYARQYQEWKSATANPTLISRLYVLDLTPGGRSRAFRLDQNTFRFQPVEWPAEFDKIGDGLKQPAYSTPSRSSTASADNGLREGGVDTSDQEFASHFYPASPLARWHFEPTMPLLLRRVAGSAAGPSPGPYGHRETQEWLVIQLSWKCIKEQILPGLARRYFQGTRGLDYQVAVVAGRSRLRRVVYSSGLGFGNEKVLNADGTMDVFGRIQDRALGSPIHIFQPAQISGSDPSAETSWFPLLYGTPQDQDWRLIVRHRRGGPLGAFIAELRRRNLAVSFGTLLLLVVCVTMLIIINRQEQRVAKLQMDFVANVSHELRTPVTVICSAADNIAHGVIEGREQLAQYGSIIGNHARKLDELVEQILLFAAVSKSHRHYALRPLEVHEIIAAALSGTSRLLREAQFVLEQDIASDLPPVLGDLPALSRCLQNLLINALKYGGEQRWIGIRARAAERGPGGNEVQISVEDRGMGIDSSDLPYIFEPFYRSPSVAQIHGTGLGLPLAKSIVEAMKGRLTVTSTRGRGSTFTLHLHLA
ncbi:MAG TPA: HAMP domain-containing sensor histidine kinase [Patescibacteria group bacterium]|nr:HAMP domain-containing sensor histidine kinase [Patescibacteria group bacterium]